MHWETHIEDFMKYGIEYCNEKREKIKKYDLISGST
jgi:hypothetical protein